MIEHCIHECFHFHTYTLWHYWQGGGNVFFTIMTGVLALKGNHGKSRLVEVTHCMKGME